MINSDKVSQYIPFTPYRISNGIVWEANSFTPGESCGNVPLLHTYTSEQLMISGIACGTEGCQATEESHHMCYLQCFHCKILFEECRTSFFILIQNTLFCQQVTSLCATSMSLLFAFTQQHVRSIITNIL